MSKKGDFLSGFSDGSTQKPLTPAKEKTHEAQPSHQPRVESEEVKPSKKRSDQTRVAENKKIADQLVAEEEKRASAARSGTVSRPAQNASAIIKAPEHAVAKDEKFHQRKLVKYGLIGGITLVAIVVIFFLFRMVTSVEMLDWSGREFREAQEWGILNDIGIERQEAYSLEYAENQIMSQNREPGSTAPRGSVLSLTVSLGPDMNERIELPDFETMTASQIRSWRIEYQVMSVVVRDEASSEVENHGFIRMEVPSDVDVNDFRRSDSMVIYVSSGPSTIQMPDFRTAPGNTREHVERFVSDHPEIDVTIVDEISDTVLRDEVIGQSAPPNANLSPGDAITVTISVGTAVVVPDFSVIARDDALNAGGEGLQVEVREMYNASVAFGHFVSQSVEAGTELFEANPVVVVTYSRRLPWMPTFSMENEIQDAMFDFNRQGAPITYRVDQVDDCAPRGTIIYQSLYNQYVALNSHVVFNVSRGNLTCPEPEPDFPDFPSGGDGGMGDHPGPGPSDVPGGSEMGDLPGDDAGGYFPDDPEME